MLGTELGDLPSRDIAVHAVEKGCVRPHLRRKGIKEARCLQQDIHALIDVAYKDHGSVGCFFLLPTSKRTGGHIVFHDLNSVFILEADAGNFIESDAVPQADKTHGMLSHVIKQVSYCRLSAGHQNAVRRDLLEQMRFTGATWSQLAEVEVVLHQGDHTQEKQPLFPIGQLIRLHADGTQEHIDPFILGESLSTLLQLIKIHMRHLDGCQLPNTDKGFIFLLRLTIRKHNVRILLVVVFQLDDAPDTTT